MVFVNFSFSKLETNINTALQELCIVQQDVVRLHDRKKSLKQLQRNKNKNVPHRYNFLPIKYGMTVAFKKKKKNYRLWYPKIVSLSFSHHKFNNLPHEGGLLIDVAEQIVQNWLTHKLTHKTCPRSFF